jgi:hypothetical protein
MLSITVCTVPVYRGWSIYWRLMSPGIFIEAKCPRLFYIACEVVHVVCVSESEAVHDWRVYHQSVPLDVKPLETHDQRFFYPIEPLR